jgi:hypothetical protein
MRVFPMKALIFLGSIILLVFVIVGLNNYMLTKGYEQIASLPATWPGTPTGKSCHRDSECGSCGFNKNTFPPKIVCRCLPHFKRCGLGYRSATAER